MYFLGRAIISGNPLEAKNILITIPEDDIEEQLQLSIISEDIEQSYDIFKIFYPEIIERIQNETLSMFLSAPYDM
jgi:predicted choloylglycine hydrolase